MGQKTFVASESAHIKTPMITGKKGANSSGAVPDYAVPGAVY
jgi:hypothetical protein